jgi:hypothetical protein
VDVSHDQSGAFDQIRDAGCVEAPWQGVRGAPSTVITDERALGLGELAGECASQDGGDAGGDHKADVSAVGQYFGDGS